MINRDSVSTDFWPTFYKKYFLTQFLINRAGTARLPIKRPISTDLLNTFKSPCDSCVLYTTEQPRLAHKGREVVENEIPVPLNKSKMHSDASTQGNEKIPDYKQEAAAVLISAQRNCRHGTFKRRARAIMFKGTHNFFINIFIRHSMYAKTT